MADLRLRIALCGLLALFVTNASAQQLPRTFDACDYCIASQGVSPIESGSSCLRYDMRYLSLSKMYDEGKQIENPRNALETHLTQQLTLSFHLSEAVSVSGILPFASRYERVQAGIGESGEREDDELNLNRGIADAALLGRFYVLRDHQIADTRLLSINAGVKLPTGATTARTQEGELLDAHMQLGSGSVDALIGVSGLLAWERFAIASNLMFAVTGRGANDHTFGNNLNYDLTARYKLSSPEMTFPAAYATLGLTGELRGHELLRTESVWTPDENSGGNTTYIAPGVQFFITDALSLEASYQLAVVHELDGVQQGESYRLMSGLQYGL